MDRQANLDRLLDDFPGTPDEYVQEPRAWALVQENVGSSRTPPFWVTTHHNQADATDYLNTEEYPEDWEVIRWVNLDSGKAFQATRTFSIDIGQEVTHADEGTPEVRD